MLLSKETIWVLVALFHFSCADINPIDGEIISISPAQSCTNIYDNDGKSNLLCNTASVIELLLSPDPVGGGIQFVFQNTQQNGAGGGQGKPDCGGENPGLCIGTQPFIIDIQVSPILTSYALDYVGVDSPFGYMYSNCLTRSGGYSPGNRASGGPYPDTVLDQCGPTMSYNAYDFTGCDDAGFAVDGNTAIYSESIFMCGLDKQKALDKGTLMSESMNHDLVEQFLHTGGIAPPDPHLACKPVNFVAGDGVGDGCLRNFPRPVSLCPCGGGSDKFTPMDNTPTYDNGFVPVTVCKSGTCAGTCGSALGLADPDNGEVSTNACGGVSMSFDECCNVSDSLSLCANTRQRHRCLKCQPKGNSNHADHYCYYMDLNVDFRCAWDGTAERDRYDFSDYCGNGDYTNGGYFDPSTTGANEKKVRIQRDCNCDANFVEKIYPVAPICNPFIIRNPPKLEYTVNITFLTMDGIKINGSLMTVGSGWSPENTAMPPIFNLSPFEYTIDGFALTKILAADAATGKQASDLHGLIVMCDNQLNAACSSTTGDVGFGNGTIDRSGLPSTVLDVSSPDCRVNPWTGNPGDVIFDPNEGKVPLPDHIYKYADRGHQDGSNEEKKIEKDHAAWWYYVNHRNTEDYGRGCGQIGLFPGGDSDPSTAHAMCNGPMGSCVPGLDTLQRGEIVDPPCNVARDFYEFLVRVNTEDGGTRTACNIPKQKQSGIIPKHVPIDWNPQTPNYWVCGGRLFHESDPETNYVNIHMTISVAADFVGEMVTQSPGVFADEPQTCSLFLDIATGLVTVNVQNTGTQTAEYVLIADCTQGIIMSNPNGEIFSVAPGTGGDALYQQVKLGLVNPVQLTPSTEEKDADLLVPSCIISLYPSTLITERFLQAKTDPIQCVVDFALIIIRPNSGPIILPDGVGDKIPAVYGSGCSSWNIFCDLTFGHPGFFSAIEMMFIDLALIAVFFALIIWFLTNLLKNAGGESSYIQGEADELQVLAKQNKMVNQLSKKKVAKEDEKLGFVDPEKTK
jgi:hypothetical protein